MHISMQTSAKPVMTKLQNLFVVFVNTYIFQMTLKFSLLIINKQVQFLLKDICRMHADSLQMYAVSAPFELLLNFP